jgi:hypothetical protein
MIQINANDTFWTGINRGQVLLSDTELNFVNRQRNAKPPAAYTIILANLSTMSSSINQVLVKMRRVFENKDYLKTTYRYFIDSSKNYFPILFIIGLWQRFIGR